MNDLYIYLIRMGLVFLKVPEMTKKGKKIINLSFLFYSSEKISTNHGIDIRQIEKKSRNKL